MCTLIYLILLIVLIKIRPRILFALGVLFLLFLSGIMFLLQVLGTDNNLNAQLLNYKIIIPYVAVLLTYIIYNVRKATEIEEIPLRMYIAENKLWYIASGVLLVMLMICGVSNAA